MKSENRILRGPDFTKIAERIMDLVLEYIWAPLVAWLAAISALMHRHGRDIATLIASQSNLNSAVEDARGSRKEIYDKIETTRSELTQQHEILRKEQREDFQEIRKAITDLGK